ncbi:MAG TPA: class I SAM-dependent methyltransferase [Opitutaceae bacterium]|jgi:SAM-dependent methyltransferase|nr:class I SAM-dependent methyltransferase [Opitutaceae bacterium]
MSETIPQIKHYYDEYWAGGRATYSGANQGYASNFRRWMAGELADLPPDAPIIEVGCGDGSFTRDLSALSSSVTAIDISELQIEENARSMPAIRFRQHDVAEPFPFADGSFDVVWCSEVLEHLFNPLFAMQEMHRILKPGGRLLLTVPYHGVFKNLLIVLFKWDVHFSPSNPHIRFYTRRTLEGMTREAGFEDIRTRTCGMDRPLRDLLVPTNLLLRATKGRAVLGA